MGHSAGGAFTQILMDRGYGAAGVAINSAPTEGVKRVPLSQLRSTFPVLKNPANRHKAVGFTFEQWRYAFTNTFSEEESRGLYERYHIPASGRVFWGAPSRTSTPARRHARQLQEPQPCSAPLHLGERRSPDAAEDPALERQALQGRRDDHRDQGVRGPLAPHALPGGMGGDRRLRPDVVGRQRARLGDEPVDAEHG